MKPEDIQKILEEQRATSPIFQKKEGSINVTIAQYERFQVAEEKEKHIERMKKLHKSGEQSQRILKGMEKVKKDPKWIQKVRQANKDKMTIQVKEKISQTMKNKFKDPEYQKRLVEGLEKRNKSEWSKNVRQAVRNTTQTVEWKKKYYLGRGNQPIRLGDYGVFSGVNKCVEHLKMLGIANAAKKPKIWMRTDPVKYYYISIEEYYNIKGHWPWE